MARDRRGPISWLQIALMIVVASGLLVVLLQVLTHD